MVMGGDSRSKGCGFESQRWMDMTFFTLICCNNCIVCLKSPKINEKEARVGPFLKKTNNSIPPPCPIQGMWGGRITSCVAVQYKVLQYLCFSYFGKNTFYSICPTLTVCLFSFFVYTFSHFQVHTHRHTHSSTI